MSADEPYRATPDAPAPSDASTRWARAWAWLLVHRDGLGLFAFVALAATCAFFCKDPDGLWGAVSVALIGGEALTGLVHWTKVDGNGSDRAQETCLAGALIMLAAFVTGTALAAFVTGTALAVLGAVLS